MDLNLVKLLSKEQEKQVAEILNNTTLLIATAQEVIERANITIENVNEITNKLKAILK